MNLAPFSYSRPRAFWISLLTLILAQLGSQAQASTGFDHDANGNLTAIRAALAGIPVIETQPRCFSTEEGGGGMSVMVTSASPVTYQWKQADGTDVAGATSDTLFFPQITPALEGLYYVVITNAAGSVNSNMIGLNWAGELDSGFTPNVNGAVTSLAMLSDGKVLIGGYLTVGSSIAPYGVVKLNADGSLNTANFSASANGPVNCLAVQSNGQVLIGGRFTTVATRDIVQRQGLPRNYVARVSPTTYGGTLDAFNPNPNAEVTCLAVQSDGKVLIGGGFTTVGGVSRNCIARLNADGRLDTGFNPDVNGTVNSVAVQSDGKVLIGGDFTTVGGVTRNYIARLNADGSLDTGFDPNTGGAVTSMALQADGKLLIGGVFTSVGGVTRNRIARLNADGSLDLGFNPNANNAVTSLVVQSDGKVLIGGNFTVLGGVIRNYVARLNSDGNLDTGFNPNPGGRVYGLALQADGRVLIGGDFTMMGGVTRNYLARVVNDPAFQNLTNPDVTKVLWSRSGAAPEVSDVIFEQSLNNGLTWSQLGVGARVGATSDWQLTGLNLAAGAKLRAKGRVTGGNMNGSSGLIQQSFPSADLGATLSATPAVDSAIGGGPRAMTLIGSVNSVGFGITERGFVYALRATNASMEIGGTGVVKLAVSGTDAGDFSAMATGLKPGASYSYRSYVTDSSGTSYSAVGFFTTDALGAVVGDIDLSFDPNLGAIGASDAMAFQADGKLLLGGVFTSVSGVTRNRIARLNADGSLDAGFDPNAGGRVYGLAFQADGRLLIGGEFTTMGGLICNRIARLNPGGSLDSGFNPNVNQTVYGLALQADGKVLIGGDFTSVSGVTRNRIARLNFDGSLDTGFNPNAGSRVNSLVVQPDGKVLIGGYFTTVGGVARNRIARLNADGGLDTSFNPDANGEVFSLAVQADGKVLIGGDFTSVSGVTRNGIARLNANGSLDTGFNPNANNTVRSLALQADGKVLIGGGFTAVGGVTRNYVARLNADGNLDTGFTVNAGGFVSGLALQMDGRVLIGGYFTTVSGVTRNGIARVVNDPAFQNLTNPDATKVLWSRGGAAPEVSDVFFEQSLNNGGTWSQLGVGARVWGKADWQLTGLNLAAGAKLRAKGRTTGGSGNSSTGLIQQSFPSPGLGSTLSASPVAGSATTMTLGGSVSSDGVGMTERGFVYAVSATNATPEIGGTGVTRLAASGIGLGSFSALATGLIPGTIYSYRSYVTDSSGTTYSAVGSFIQLSLQERWRQTYFGNTASVGNGADDADPDGDGLKNLLEYALNLPPTASSHFTANVAVTSGRVEYTYSRGTEAFNGGTTYQVEWSDDLTTWSGAGVLQILLSDDGTTQQVRATLPAGSSGRRFVRLRVQ